MHHKDLHLFTSNVIFSRVSTPDLSTTVPQVDPTSITSRGMLISGSTTDTNCLQDAYRVIVGRMLTKLPQFNYLQKFLPVHIPHLYSVKMARKSIVIPLGIQHKNETKHEDCIAIMDTYMDKLTELFLAAFGEFSFTENVSNLFSLEILSQTYKSVHVFEVFTHKLQT